MAGSLQPGGSPEGLPLRAEEHSGTKVSRKQGVENGEAHPVKRECLSIGPHAVLSVLFVRMAAQMRRATSRPSTFYCTTQRSFVK